MVQCASGKTREQWLTQNCFGVNLFMMATKKYGSTKFDGPNELSIEFHLIRNADERAKAGTTLLEHYLNAEKLLWPEDDQHRWSRLAMKSLVENKVSVFMGSANSAKTTAMSKHALIDFFIFPHTSLALISSTEKRSLELKVWGRIKSLFNRARRAHLWLPGFILESAMVINVDDVDDDGEFARELNRGIVCVPCVSGGRFVGMGKFQGAKPPHTPGKNDGLLKHYGDEAAVMQASFLDAYTNWMSNSNFKGAMAGNPTDISDPLCTAGEPEGGWDAFIDTAKTQEWTSKWYGAHVISFDGRDSPNNDQPGKKYPYLVDSSFIEQLERTHGSDSWQLFQQGIGKPSKGMVSNRVLTIGFCEQHKAFETPLWKKTPTMLLGACDPAYGGGDRCVWITGRIGVDAEDRQLLQIDIPEVIPIKLNSAAEPEQQIVAFIKSKCENLGIPPENVFYDSFGRGTLGAFFAELFGKNSPVPVDSGKRPSDRPVRFDLMTEDNGKRRPIRCDEHYSKFVTEMWFSVREAVHSEQIRSLPRTVAEEFQMRLFKVVSGNRVEIENKEDLKERIKKSPDLADGCAILVEGARQRGFRIERIGANVEPSPQQNDKWLTDLARKRYKWNQSKQLQTN
jgi:hypothetical protein